jgi:hypothetical protein
LVINSKGSSHPNKEEKLVGSVHIPYVKGISENLKSIGNIYNIRTTFKIKMYAIKACAVENLDRNCKNRNIYIL